MVEFIEGRSYAFDTYVVVAKKHKDAYIFKGKFR
ncbi:MAG: hypothetical protein ACI93P_002719 [bacterium]|jgi:hypothetical protein